MIPNITYGDRMPGLMAYLAGPGRANEHADVHVVAASSLLTSAEFGTALDAAAAQDLAREMDLPKQIFGTKTPRGHVFHCSLALHADEGVLPDARWNEIVQEFVHEMGFTEESGKSPSRWVAVRHGLSKAGNDHVHLVVSVVREDGTKWSPHNDRIIAQRAARKLEKQFGLVQLEARTAERGYSPAERARADREGTPELGRDTLQRTVRACASASLSEDEFVRRMRGAGVLVRPRFAQGRTDVVEGYSVAQAPPPGSTPIWYGGGRLARDLTLPQLRQQWPDTVQAATAALDEWTSAKSNRRPVAPGRETLVPSGDAWSAAAGDFAALYERVVALPSTDTVAWASLAREGAGMLSAWSLRTEATPGPLADAAKAMWRSAQPPTLPAALRHAPLPSARGASMILMQAAVGASTHAGERLLFAQLQQTMVAIADMHHASGAAREASRLRVTAGGALERVHTRMAGATAPITPSRAASRWLATPAQPTFTTTPASAPGGGIEAAELAELRRLREKAHGASGRPTSTPSSQPPAPAETVRLRDRGAEDRGHGRG